MSMENAILEHAAALRELSASIKAMHAGRGDALALPASQGGLVNQVVEKAAADAAKGEATSPARQAIQAALDAAKAGSTKAAGKPDAELEQAVQKVEDSAAAEKARIDADTKAAEANRTEVHLEAPADLDYAKDVRPVLLAAIKAAGKDTVATMLKTFGVEKADQLKPAQLPGAVAEAQKLIAAAEAAKAA